MVRIDRIVPGVGLEGFVRGKRGYLGVEGKGRERIVVEFL